MAIGSGACGAARPATRDRAAFRGVLIGFGSALALAILAVMAGLVLLDPYDSGRGPSLLGRGIAVHAPRLANASRGRDAAYEAAILGNSHVQLLSPGRLQAKTGLAFVSLVVPGSGVGEHLSLLNWWLAHRRDPPRAVVIGVDHFACTPGEALLQTNPFPFWLYDRDPVSYLAGLFNTVSVNHAAERLAARFAARFAGPLRRPLAPA